MPSAASRWTLRILIGVALIAVVGWYLHSHSSGSSHDHAASTAKGGSGDKRVVPVQVVSVVGEPHHHGRGYATLAAGRFEEGARLESRDRPRD